MSLTYDDPKRTRNTTAPDIRRRVARLICNRGLNHAAQALGTSRERLLVRWLGLAYVSAHWPLSAADALHVFRAEGHARTDSRHDLRATFVTVSLANRKTETWFTDRTGTSLEPNDQPLPPSSPNVGKSLAWAPWRPSISPSRSLPPLPLGALPQGPGLPVTLRRERDSNPRYRCRYT
jgi:hypothetical protein